MTIHPYVFVIACVIFNVISQILLKTGMNEIGDFEINSEGLLNIGLKTITNPNIIIGLFLYGLSFVVWLIALSKLEVSVAYPLLSIGYIITPFMGYLFLHESLSIIKIIGICIIIIGVYVVARS